MLLANLCIVIKIFVLCDGLLYCRAFFQYNLPVIMLIVTMIGRDVGEKF